MSNTAISCQTSVLIEKDVMLGGGVCIYDTDFHSLNRFIRMELNDIPEVPKSKGILIKEGAFIGAGTCILKGVTIGNNSVVGACSVVTKDIPDNQVWAGNPTVFIRELKKEELINGELEQTN